MHPLRALRARQLRTPFACPSRALAARRRPSRAGARLADRAACFQQMREPKLALADVEHVIRFDPKNAKALARKTVYENQVAGGL